MKRLLWFLTAALWLTAVACGPTTEEDSTQTPPDNGGGLNAAPTPESETETENDVFPRATLTPLPADDLVQPESVTGSEAEGYPAPALPEPSPLPEGYEIPTAPPAINPYPEATGELLWILKPVGEQCAETPTTPDLQTAVADMIAFGIPVEASEMAEMDVCTECGCPTSAHFRLQIDSGYLGNAQVLGWVAEE
ncbi:MAG: hypothetical protein IPM53_32895 [Anaerolineaceae bacterium]|nr:hypothetical protein [Anaerolineaceae bacterium]